MAWLESLFRFVGAYGLSTVLVILTFYLVAFRLCPWIGAGISETAKWARALVEQAVGEHIETMRTMRDSIIQGVEKHDAHDARTTRIGRAIVHVGDAVLESADELRKAKAEPHVAAAKRIIESESA